MYISHRVTRCYIILCERYLCSYAHTNCATSNADEDNAVVDNDDANDSIHDADDANDGLDNDDNDDNVLMIIRSFRSECC